MSSFVDVLGGSGTSSDQKIITMAMLGVEHGSARNDGSG